MNIFDTLLINPFINILLAFYQLLYSFGAPYALAFSIILMTVFVRLLLYPLTGSQLRASKKMQDVAPHVSALKQKHKGDPKRLQQETMSLYKTHGINPAAGCLPILVQFPLIIALYSMLQKIVTASPIETLKRVNDIAYFDFLKLHSPWDAHFFGIPLAQKPSELWSMLGAAVFLVPVITGLLQFLQSKMMVPAKQKAKLDEKKNQDNKDKKPSLEGDFASAFQTQSLYIFPVMIGFISYTFPLGLSLYWNTFTIFGIIQQYKMQGWGGLAPWIDRLKAKK